MTYELLDVARYESCGTRSDKHCARELGDEETVEYSFRQCSVGDVVELYRYSSHEA